MRLDEIRGSRIPGLGSLELRPGPGLVGWSGGDPRVRRRFSDFLGRALGLPRSTAGRQPRGEDPDAVPVSELRVNVAGRTVRVGRGGTVGGDGDGRSGALAALVGLTPADLALVWTGREEEGSALLEEGARILAGLRGLGLLESALRRVEKNGSSPGPELEAEGGPPPGEQARLRAELEEIRRRLRALRGVPDRLRSLEDELRSLRADAAEVVGDLEEASMEWLREQQDAETHLQAYRDRARELRGRIRELEEAGPRGTCPFCARPLGEHYEEVLAGLRDEWESLVQDGRWWRRRRDQLDLKPDRLQELEGRTVRLQAAVEACAERLERCRFELRERDELRERAAQIVDALGDGSRARPGPAAGTEAESGARGEARRALEAARADLLDDGRTRLLRGAGSYLNRISGGRILGLLPDGDGGVEAVEDGRRLAAPTEQDRAAIGVALRLALAERAVAEGLPLGSIVVEEPFDRMELQARLRAVEVLRDLRERIPQILLIADGEVTDAAPERFDGILEAREDPHGRRSRLRRVPGGVGTVRLRGVAP